MPLAHSKPAEFVKEIKWTQEMYFFFASLEIYAKSLQ